MLARFLDEREPVAGVGPVYANPDGSPQPFHFRFPTFATTLANGSSLVRRLVPGSERRLREYRMLDDDFSRPRPVPQPSASCLLLRRSVLPREQLLDERYPLYFNDVQLARSLADQGLELWVTPEAVAVHNAHASGLMLPPAARRRQYIGAVVRMLMDTEPFYKVWLYRTIVLVQNLALWALDRPEALRGRDLLAALDGNPGPLPVRPLETATRPGRTTPERAVGVGIPGSGGLLVATLAMNSHACGLLEGRRSRGLIPASGRSVRSASPGHSAFRPLRFEAAWSRLVEPEQ